MNGYKNVEVLTTDLFYDTATEYSKDDEEIWYKEEDYNSKKPKNFKWIKNGYHAWVYVNGKHYDSDAPNGVANFYDLPIFKSKYADGGEVGQDITCKNCGWEWNTSQSEKHDKYVCHNCGFDNTTYYDKDVMGFKDGGLTDEDKAETYAKWKSLVNMSKSELERFYNSQEGKDAGLSSSEANAQGIDSGRESARWIMKMKDTPYKEWTPQMWKWAKKQISFISRMSGNKGGLYDDKGRKTRKHTSLLIWGHNPEKMNNGGLIVDGINIDEAVKQFRIAYPTTDDRYMTSNERRSESLKSNYARKRLEKILGFDIGDLYRMTERQRQIREIVYDRLREKRQGNYNDGGLIVDGKKSTREELTEIYQSVWRVESYGFELNPHKIQYSGDDEQIIQTIEEYNRLTNPYSSRSGKLKEAYMKQVISNAFSDTPFRKFTNAFRKNIDPYFSSDNNRHVGFKFSSFASYVIGDGSYYVDEEQFRNFAKDLKIKIPERTFDNGGEINKIKNTNMDNVRFNQLPHIDTISEGDDIILYESVFAGNIDQPKHIGERYIHCKAMKMGGMVNSLDLEVINSVGANPLVVGQLITRPITNVLVRGRKLIVEPIAQAIAFKDGGLNPDNKDVKGYFAHGSGNAGGVLVGKRHSEGGIKAINKSTGQPLEMEGGEVVITRGAVSNSKKYDFDGKEMTTREILSKLNVDGGGVSFAEGGDVPDKMNCGCKEFKLGGQTITPQDFVAMSEKEYQQTRLQEGIKKERNDHYDTLSKLNSGAITIDNALREIAQKEMSIDKKYPFSE
jgi:hypothetical protein